MYNSVPRGDYGQSAHKKVKNKRTNQRGKISVCNFMVELVNLCSCLHPIGEQSNTSRMVEITLKLKKKSLYAHTKKKCNEDNDGNINNNGPRAQSVREHIDES